MDMMNRSAGLGSITHAILRIGAGILFSIHGMPKLFGWFGGVDGEGASAELMSQMGLAGVLEVFGGVLIALGLLTRPLAVILALEMLLAYVQAHLPQGWNPYLNRGELALLYMFVWIFLVGNGAGAASLDGVIARRKRDAYPG